MISTQFSKTIKIFHTDNAMEYRDSQFLDFIHTQGTIIQRSCAETSQQNGRAECKYRHILDSVRAFLISASCSEHFLGEAALTAVYTINHLPSSTLQNVTPFERLYGTLASYSSLRIFGCACFVLLQPQEHSKFEPRSRLCCFLGYGIEHKGYRCWDPISQRLRISRYVILWEHTTFNSLSKPEVPLWIMSLIRLLTSLLLLLLLTFLHHPKNLHRPWILSLIRLLSSPFVTLTG
jgi:hypothetical protein